MQCWPICTVQYSSVMLFSILISSCAVSLMYYCFRRMQSNTSHVMYLWTDGSGGFAGRPDCQQKTPCFVGRCTFTKDKMALRKGFSAMSMSDWMTSELTYLYCKLHSAVPEMCSENCQI